MLVIEPLVLAEVSVEDLGDALPPELYRRDPLPYEQRSWRGGAFSRTDGPEGRRVTPLPDFYIGAHAAVAGHQLLTRDAVTARATAS